MRSVAGDDFDHAVDGLAHDSAGPIERPADGGPRLDGDELVATFCPIDQGNERCSCFVLFFGARCNTTDRDAPKGGWEKPNIHELELSRIGLIGLTKVKPPG